MSIREISFHNEALIFIENRIKDDKYRGLESSQHNRYNMSKIVDILKLLNKYSPNQALLAIRNQDIRKRPANTEEEYIYAKFCDEAKNIAGIGTQDAMRKNIFVDLHRMGLINRYDKNKTASDPYSKKNIKFVSLSNQGLKLIESKNVLDQYFIFSKGIDNLLGGYIDKIIKILRDETNNINHVSFDEYMFFVSAIGTITSFNISTGEAADLIIKYRTLTPIQRRSVIAVLKSEMDPKKNLGSKTKKRDFHNWSNKIAQIFLLLNQTVYFEVRGEQLVLRENTGIFDKGDKKLSRSLNEKFLYFKEHSVEKTSGYELHHVIPLSWSESKHHFKMLDKWENMVYIDGYSHAQITQNSNKNVILETDHNNIRLSDYSGNEVYLEYNDNILYKLSKQSLIKNYNFELLKVIN